MSEPQPADDKSAPEIRGGNRPGDYIPEVTVVFGTGKSGKKYELIAHDDFEDAVQADCDDYDDDSGSEFD